MDFPTEFGGNWKTQSRDVHCFRHLHSAIYHGYADVTLALVRAAPHPRLLDTPNDAGDTPLHIAVATGQYSVVRWLVIAGTRPNPRNAQVRFARPTALQTFSKFQILPHLADAIHITRFRYK